MANGEQGLKTVMVVGQNNYRLNLYNRPSIYGYKLTEASNPSHALELLSGGKQRQENPAACDNSLDHAVESANRDPIQPSLILTSGEGSISFIREAYSLSPDTLYVIVGNSDPKTNVVKNVLGRLRSGGIDVTYLRRIVGEDMQEYVRVLLSLKRRDLAAKP